MGFLWIIPASICGFGAIITAGLYADELWSRPGADIDDGRWWRHMFAWATLCGMFIVLAFR